MALDPIVVPLPADTWVAAATNVVSGIISIMSNDPRRYFQTYRLTGELAPADNSDAVVMNCHQLRISADDPIDIYIQAQDLDGKIRVDR